MKRVFEIEWPNDHGEMWMNEDNLLYCLQQTCPNTQFTVKDVTEKSFKIKVTDIFGEGIDGAIVKIKNVTEWTDSNGLCRFRLDPGVYYIEVRTKEGVVNKTVNVAQSEIVEIKV